MGSCRSIEQISTVCTQFWVLKREKSIDKCIIRFNTFSTENEFHRRKIKIILQWLTTFGFCYAFQLDFTNEKLSVCSHQFLPKLFCKLFPTSSNVQLANFVSSYSQIRFRQNILIQSCLPLQIKTQSIAGWNLPRYRPNTLKANCLDLLCQIFS